MSLPQPAAPATDGALAALADKAAAHKLGGLRYGGEVSADEAYDFLKDNNGVLVDVRTLPEWQFVGLPDMVNAQGRLAAISWKSYPDFSANPRFAQELELAAGGDKDAPLFFICRSGGRSLDAAVAMSAAGYAHCFNVTDGFEGEPDATGQRGKRGGWKALNLPWKQG